LELGILSIVRLVFGYLETLGDKGSSDCNILAPALCRVVTADPYTVVLTIWATLQLTWVTMLLFVQLVQISRAMTTYENMRGAHHGTGHAASVDITTALAAGTLSMAGAQLGSSGRGADPALPPTHAPDGHGHHHHHKEGCFAQWKKILGVDTFLETALNGYEGNKTRTRHRENPFSRGCIGNCKDFWCDPAPIFGNRENGEAMLGGEPINYTRMYETPPRMSTRTRRGGDNSGAYESVGADDAV